MNSATPRAAPGQSRTERDRAPFTTLHPGLGVVRIDERDLVLADIPGLIGARTTATASATGSSAMSSAAGR